VTNQELQHTEASQKLQSPEESSVQHCPTMKTLLHWLLLAVSLLVFNKNNSALFAQAQQAELNFYRKLWTTLDFDDYYFEYNGFGIHVRNKQITDIMDSLFTDQLATEEDGVTVDQLFQVIQTAIEEIVPGDSRYGSIDVKYDEFYGFPASILLSSTNLEPFEAEIANFLPISILRDKYVEALNQWQSQGVESYRILYRRQFGAQQSTPLEVRVVNDKVIDVAIIATGEDFSSEIADECDCTITELFLEIQAAFEDNPVNIVILYNSQYGYPESVFIDKDKRIADEEIRFDISSFAPSISRAELDQARTKWESLSILNYAFGASLEGVEDGADATVFVENGVLTSVDGFYGQSLELLLDVVVPTIDDLFYILEGAITGQTNQVLASFDKDYGHPTSIFIDVNITSRGDEKSYTISRLMPYTLLQRSLDNAKIKWEELELDDYDFVYQNLCYCPLDYNSPKEAEVRDGVVANVTDRESGMQVSQTIQTVDRLLDNIQGYIDGRAASIEVTYDNTYGYPSRMIIDLEKALADEEIYIFVSELVPRRKSKAQTNLNEARALWSSFQMERYAYGYQRSCYCRSEFRLPLLVQVLCENVTSVTTRSGEPVSDSVASLVPTIDGLFDTIQEAINLGANETRVVYNDEFGYPESMYIDYYYFLADDEFSVTVNYIGPSTLLQTQLDEHRVVWDEMELETYTCGYVLLDKSIVVEVVNAIVTKVDGEPVEAIARSAVSDIPTIMGIFDLVQDAIDGNAFTVQVAYNELLGHPSAVFIDYDENVADDQLSISAIYVLTNGPTGASTDDMETYVPATSPTETPDSAGHVLAGGLYWFFLSIVLPFLTGVV
jgi:hypothetical protein